MASAKIPVIEYLFSKYWAEDSGTLTRSVMSLEDVVDAIRACNARDGKKRSAKNPANFLKDIVRGQSASKNWPASLQARRYTAEQRTGGGNVFEFVPYAADQNEPFPDKYKPSASTTRYQIQSLSMPDDSKALGRRDEPWITQTAVKLHVIESHFAFESPLDVVDVIHLQMSVKLRTTEIDSMYVARCNDEKRRRYSAIVTCEAKQARERILEGQIVEQVKAALEETALDVAIPLAMRAVRDVGIYVVEFQPVKRREIDSFSSLTFAAHAVYVLKPSVPGI